MCDEPSRAQRVYHGFGGRLFHDMPAWARDDAIYHIRMRCEKGSLNLTQPTVAGRLLESAKLYQQKQRWWVHLFLFMPDHCHALLSFGPSREMSATVGDWKRFHSRQSGIVWQANYFDHRLRNHLAELEAKWTYIRNNPVAAGLCERVGDWPWQWAGEEDAGPKWLESIN